ncbi:retrovirus-related pol polyprotein from transposon TNT 1-94 [Tanacetum coccineum]
MQEELNQFIANDVWELVQQPKYMKIIGTKWVYRNKLDENGVVSQNKARLVAQGYNQQEGIDYDETYALVARLESIRILLAYDYALDFKLFQMDVKSAFLNSFINEEVYVGQPSGFIDFEKTNHVYTLKKALYDLKQAPKAWYDRLKAFLIKHEYKMGMVDNTLFTKKKSSNHIIIQIYVDNIIFGSTCQDMCDEFAKIMHDEFEMSMMGELNFFLGLQIKQIEDEIFFNQSKYIKEMLKKFGLEDSKPMKTPMSSDTKLTKDEECESVDSTKYRDMIGSLLYLTASRPVSCLVSAFVHASKRIPKPLILKRLSVSFDTLKVTMPRKTAEDHQNTKIYILKISHEYTSPLIEMFKNLESRYIHEGRVVYPDFDNLVYVRSMFSHIRFGCLLDINEQIIPRFILEFYSQYHVNYTLEGQMVIEFVIQDQIFSYTLEEFGQILGIPFSGQCSFSDKWSLDDLQYSTPTSGPYQSDPPCLDDIKNYVQKEREGPATHICHDVVINVEKNQILTREIVSERYNLAYFVARRMEFVTKQPRLILPYGMLLTRLFNHVMSESPKLLNDRYVLYDVSCILLPLNKSKRLERVMAREEVALLPPLHPPSVNHPPLIPTMMIMMELTKGPRVQLTTEDDDTTTPYPITKSSSPSPPNAPSKTPSTKDTLSTFGTTSSLFESKPQSSPLSSNDTPSPQPSNPFLDDIKDAPPRPSNPLPLQSHPSLDITLSLSPITPLDHILNTPSPPSPQPPPQPPLIGHPIYFNMFDYHRVNCLCCFHNRNLIFSLRDEMNLMFAHLEFLLTSAIASPSPHHL